MLTLGDYGYYSLATLAASALIMIISPIEQAFYPLLSELHSKNDQYSMRLKFHQGAQIMSVFLGSTAVVMMFFSVEILELWTNDSNLAENSSTLLILLLLGGMFNGFGWIPHKTQLAHGWTSLSIRISFFSVIIIVPLLLIVTPIYGSVGAAAVWAGLNIMNFLIAAGLMFRVILKGEMWNWYLQDILFPVSSAFIVTFLFYNLKPDNLAPLGLLVYIVFVGICVLSVSAANANHTRKYLYSKFTKISNYLSARA